MSNKRNNSRQEDLILFGVLLLPTVWFALILAPCLGGSLVDVFSRLTERIQTPWQIEWCADSPRSILMCLLLYGFGGLVYFGTRPNLRQGE